MSSSPPEALTLESCEWLHLSGKQEMRSKHLREVLKEEQGAWIGVLGFSFPLTNDACHNSTTTDLLHEFR